MNSLHLLLALFACSAADLSMSVMERRLRGAWLFLIAPVPAALVAGMFALTYFVVVSFDHTERAWLTVTLVSAVWAVGLIYCLVATVVKALVRLVRDKPPSVEAEQRAS